MSRSAAARDTKTANSSAISTPASSQLQMSRRRCRAPFARLLLVGYLWNAPVVKRSLADKMPPNWQEAFDSTSRKTYYINMTTMALQWERPKYSSSPVTEATRQALSDTSSDLPALTPFTFGPHQTIITRIREILQQYPADHQILFELLQNADDAGATVVKVLLDLRCHSDIPGKVEELSGLKNPGVVVFNDSMFTQDDFEGIQRIGEGSKSDKPQNIGQFGIGFNSMYHLTDTPYLLSSQYVAVLDPMRKYCKSYSQLPGAQFLLTDFVREEQIMLDLLRPFCPSHFNLNLSSGLCRGTVFKLPLRTDLEGVSKEVFSVDKVKSFLHGFIDAAPQVLLFLRNVLRIDIELWEEGNTEPNGIATISRTSQPLSTSESTLVAVTSCNTGSTKERHYLLSEKTISEPSIAQLVSRLKEVSPTGKVKATAFGGVAVGLPSEDLQGGVSCFLPLERCRGTFKFIVNGAFELSSCRRDLLREPGPRADWNMLILKNVVAPLVPILLSEVTQHWPEDVPFTYLWNYFPSLSIAGDQWLEFIKAVYGCIINAKAFFPVPSGPNTWVSLSEAILFSPVKEQELGTIRSQIVHKALGGRAVTVPTHVWSILSSLKEFPSLVNTLCGSTLCTALKRSKFMPSKEEASVLLEICIETSNLAELADLPLIPLLDGTIVKFDFSRQKNKEQHILCSSDLQQDLLSSLNPRLVVDTNSLPKRVVDAFYLRCGVLHFTPFSIAVLYDVMSTHLAGVRALQPSVPSFPNGWLEKFWQLPCELWKIFYDFNLVPIVGGKFCKPSLQPLQLLVGQVEDMDKLLVVAQVLENYGVFLADLQGQLPVVGKHLTPFSCKSLAKTLLPLKGLLQMAPAQHLKVLAKFFEEIVSNSNINDYETQQAIRALPIFKLCSGEYCPLLNTSKFKLGPLGVDPCLLSCDFVCEEESGQLAEKLKIPRMSLTTFYMSVVFPSLSTMDKSLREKTALHILTVDFFCFWGKEAVLGKTRWITADNEKPECPCSLACRSTTNLQLVPAGSGCYPSEIFCEPQFIKLLQQCGMSECLPPQALTKALYNKCSTKSMTQEFSEALVHYIEINPKTLADSGLLKALNSCAWVPCKAPAPNTPWRYRTSSPNTFAVPSAVVIQSDEDLAFTMHPISGFSSLPHLPSVPFKQLTVDEITQNLVNVAKQFNAMSSKQKQEHAEDAQRLAIVCLHSLQNADNHLLPKIALYNHHPLIWAGHRFVEISKVEIENTSDLKLEPFLFTLPEALLKYQYIVQQLGVRETFTLVDLIELVNSFGTKFPRNALPADELRTTKFILHHIASLGIEYAAGSTKLKFMLTTESKLEPLETVVYDDLGQPALAGPLQKKLIDTCFSGATADVFGVTKLGLILQGSISTGLSFGQHVDVVNAIQHTLRDTTCGPRVFYEILQNADDAGADTVSILLDCTSYSCDKLLSEKMNISQGPSIMVFNNAEFKKSDWEAIQRVASASKESQFGKTGRYGVGFLSCFHITDLPSILSGNTLAFFDPLCTHVPFASPLAPGRLYVLEGAQGERLKQTFTSQFEPYKVFGWDPRSRFQGTVLRLPLRQRDVEEQQHVGLSGQHVVRTFLDSNEIKDYFTQFELAMPTTLPFLKHVRFIKIGVRERDGTCTFQSQRCIDNQPKLRADLQKFVTSGQFQNGGTKKCVRVVEIIMQEGSALPVKSTWVVAEAVIVDNRTQGELQKNKAKGIASIAPWIGVAAPVTVVPPITKALKHFVPYSGPGTLNCFLPLPELSGLPVAINAIFELSTGRELTSSVAQSLWNQILFSLISEVYCQLVVWLRDHVHPSHPEALYSVIPTSCDPFGIAKALWDALQNEKVIHSFVTKTWNLPTVACNINQYPLQPAPPSVLNFLERCHVPLAKAPDSIVVRLRIKEVNPEFVAEFLQQHKFPPKDLTTETCTMLHDALGYCLKILQPNFPIITSGAISKLGPSADLVFFSNDPNVVEVISKSAVAHIIDNESSQILSLQALPKGLGLKGPLTSTWVLHNLLNCKAPAEGKKVWNRELQPLTWFSKLYSVLDNLLCRNLSACTDAILPASDGYVYSPQRAQEVTERPNFEKGPLNGVLDSLCFPIVAVDNETDLHFLRACSQLLQPFTIDTFINALATNKSLHWDSLSQDQAEYLLHFFESNLPLHKKPLLQKLALLPLFYSPSKQCSCIQPNSWVIPHEFPCSLYPFCPISDNTVTVLQPKMVSLDFMLSLGFQRTNWTALFQSLSEGLRSLGQPWPIELLTDWQNLVFEQFFCIPFDNVKTTAAVIATVPFLWSDANTLRAPAELFSPDNELLELAFKGSDYLPHMSSYTKWKPILNQLPLLQFTVNTSGVVVKAVLSQRETAVSKLRGCLLLMKELYENWEGLYDALKGSPIVPCEFRLPTSLSGNLKPLLSSSKQTGVIYLCPEQCIDSNRCCWTQVPGIIQDKAEEDHALTKFPKCQVRTMLAHASALSQFALIDGHDEDTLITVSNELLLVAEQLNMEKEVLDDQQCCWSVALRVRNNFKPCAHIFLELKDEIETHMYCVPDEFKHCKHFLKLSGVRPLPSIDEVSRALGTYGGSTKFNANDKKRICQLLSLYLQLLGDDHHPDGEVLVPANEWSCMMRASETVYFDKEHWKMVIKQDLVPSCSLNMGKDLGSRPISQSVQEEPEPVGPFFEATELRNTITSMEFKKALCAILDVRRDSKHTGDKQEEKQRTADKLQEMANWSYLWVDSLSTKYFFKGTDVTVAPSHGDAPLPSPCVFDPVQKKIIATGEPMCTTIVAKEIVNFLQLDIDYGCISAMLQTSKDKLLQAIIQLGIPIGLKNFAQCGEPVLDSEHYLLQKKLFSITFAKGEIVTYVDANETWRYGLVLASGTTVEPSVQINSCNTSTLHPSLIMRMTQKLSSRESQQPASLREIVTSANTLAENLATLSFNQQWFALLRMAAVLETCKADSPEATRAFRMITKHLDQLPPLLLLFKRNSEIADLVMYYLCKEEALALGRTCKWLYRVVTSSLVYRFLATRSGVVISDEAGVEPPTNRTRTTPARRRAAQRRRAQHTPTPVIDDCGCLHCPLHCGLGNHS
ncbi:Sacsin protein [Pelomyxa schiedti]|nr:Sacsin protein [Pelomyxa schiedti]